MEQYFRSILRASISKKSSPLVNTFRVVRTLLRKEKVIRNRFQDAKNIKTKITKLQRRIIWDY